MQVIEILDQNNDVVANVVTDKPKFSFDQYCRNREAIGWSWRVAREDNAASTLTA